MRSVVRRPAIAAGIIAVTIGAAACGSSSSGSSPSGGTSSKASGPLTVLAYQKQDAANLALSNGRADVGMADSPVAAYIAEQSHGQFKVSGQPYGTAPYGIAMGKNSGTLDKAILAALKDVMADGTYGQILAKWDISEGGIGNPVINGATSTTVPAPSPSATTAPMADPNAQALLPSSIKSSGKLSVAADATYAPNEYLAADGKTVIGMDADLAKALGTVLGLNVSIQNATFDAIIPAIQDGRYDLGMSSFTDTADREKQVNFVTYFSAGTSFYVRTDGGPTINSLADLCGQKVAVESGTTQEADAKAQSKKC
jgi:ABC-type amino acid transport substrate-binding protein